MSTERTFTVTEIQRFCMHDGPGLRTTVFFKGCPLHCAWCHNPETQKSKPELLFYPNKCIGCAVCADSCAKGAHVLNDKHRIDRARCVLCGECADNCPTGALEICGKEYTVGDILSAAEKDRAFYGESGGITLSGGEPLAQGETVIDLLKACRKHGFSMAVETCGYAEPDVLRAAVPYVDLFLWDIKDTDSARHRQYTGVGNERILQNLALVNEMNGRIRLRCILVNGVNTDERHYSAVAELAKKIGNSGGVELIPYHAYAGTKSVFLGGEDNGRKDWIPETAEIERAGAVLRSHGVYVY